MTFSGTGHSLASVSSVGCASVPSAGLPLPPFVSSSSIVLPPEPESGGCLLQVRSGSGGSVRRRFGTDDTLKHVYSWAEQELGVTGNGWRLVSRFPRRVFERNDEQVGRVFQKQEALFIENI